jgi:hypothetical protein
VNAGSQKLQPKPTSCPHCQTPKSTTTQHHHRKQSRAVEQQHNLLWICVLNCLFSSLVRFVRAAASVRTAQIQCGDSCSFQHTVSRGTSIRSTIYRAQRRRLPPFLSSTMWASFRRRALALLPLLSAVLVSAILPPGVTAQGEVNTERTGDETENGLKCRRRTAAQWWCGSCSSSGMYISFLSSHSAKTAETVCRWVRWTVALFLSIVTDFHSAHHCAFTL